MLLVKRGTLEAEIGLKMAPLIDIVFLLLIFFMCVTEFSRREVEPLTLPRAMAGREGPEPRAPAVVNVMRDGSYRVSGRTLSSDELDAFLRRSAIGAGEEDGASRLAVRIRADAGTSYQHVQRVIVECGKSRISRISFGVAPRDEPAAGAGH